MSRTTVFALLLVSFRFLSTTAFSQQIQIRQVDHTSPPSELESAVDLIFEIASSVKDHRMTQEQFSEEGITARTFLAEFQSGDSAMWIASLQQRQHHHHHHDNNDMVDIGYCMADSKDRNLSALFVRPIHEGLGAGRLLLEQAENWLWNLDDEDPIWVATLKDPSLRAFGFYKRMGYIPVGTMQNVADINDSLDLAQILVFVKKKSGASIHMEEDMPVFRQLLRQSKVILDYYAMMNLCLKGLYSPKAMEQYRLGRSASPSPTDFGSK